MRRRDVIKGGGIAGAGAILGTIFARTGLAGAAIPTPSQIEGPFYPVKDQLDKDADLTRVKGRPEEALGQRWLIRGRVLDVQTNEALPGALVEFWQACESGRYDHPSDPNQAPLDPNFQYWAQVRTDPNGFFSLKTIKPGAYPADDNWTRPPHIHVKVHQVGYPSLTTQIYFAGDPLNDHDRILQALSPEEKLLVTLVPGRRDLSATIHADLDLLIAKYSGGNHDVRRVATPTLD